MLQSSSATWKPVLDTERWERERRNCGWEIKRENLDYDCCYLCSCFLLLFYNISFNVLPHCWLLHIKKYFFIHKLSEREKSEIFLSFFGRKIIYKWIVNKRAQQTIRDDIVSWMWQARINIYTDLVVIMSWKKNYLKCFWVYWRF